MHLNSFGDWFSMAILVAIVVAGVFYAWKANKQATPAQRRHVIFWTPVMVFGGLTLLTYASEKKDGSPQVATLDGFVALMVFGGLTIFFWCLASLRAAHRPRSKQSAAHRGH